MRRAVVGALVAGVAAVALLGRARLEPVGRRATAERAGPVVAASPDETSGTVARAASPSRGRPRSLRGTRTDGGLVVDADGRFVPTIDARRLFDYFLTGSGELPADALRARIVREIERRLVGDAARDATTLLDHYLAYRERVRLLAADGAPDDLDARLATLVTLRREALGPEAAQAFFADEEADARRLLEVRRITSDPGLSVEERATRVEATYAQLEADLPSAVREARAAARLATTLRSAEEEVRAQGGDAAAVQALRERLAGPEAAARLADLDQRRAEWQGRVDAFRGARDRIERDSSLAPSARAAAVERLLAESFTPPERLRLQALERIAASQAAAPSR